MAEALSLVISNPNEGDFLKKIDWNKEEFMEMVATITEQYKGLTYTEEQMKQAKEDRATLNKMKKAISDRRIEVKNAVMAPYTQFENEVKEVVALIEEPISMIDAQIKEYEENAKAEKRKVLEEHFNEVATELEGILTFVKIFDQKWLNAAVSIKKAKEEVNVKVGKVKADIETIKNVCGEKYHTVLIDNYIKNLDISKTLNEHSRLMEMDRKLEEEKARKAEEEERKAEMARLKAEQETTITETAEATSNQPETVIEKPKTVIVLPPDSMDAVDPFASQEDTKQYKASFSVYGTKSQIMALKQYMIDNNIKFGKVE